MPKKILYLFSDTGGGHRSAANALIRAVQKVAEQAVDQEMVDVFAQCSSFLNIFAKLYAPVIKYSPQFWGRLYYWLDDWKKLDALQKLASPFILDDLTKMLEEKSPDVIVSVHPLVNHLAVDAVKHLNRSTPIITMVMDPVTIHKSWVCPQVNLLIVATQAAKDLAIQYGMPADKIKVLGIPIDPRFLERKAKEPLRKEMELDPHQFTILMMGGGEGGGGLLEIVQALGQAKFDGQIIVICGRNLRLKKKLEAANLPFKAKIYGFTDEVPTIMDAADMIITKAGPGTIAESIAKELPMIITSWLPGQEEGNVEFVKHENIGQVESDPLKVPAVIAQMRRGNEFENLKKNLSRVARPQAALDIARVILSYL